MLRRQDKKKAGRRRGKARKGGMAVRWAVELLPVRRDSGTLCSKTVSLKATNLRVVLEEGQDAASAAAAAAEFAKAADAERQPCRQHPEEEAEDEAAGGVIASATVAQTCAHTEVPWDRPTSVAPAQAQRKWRRDVATALKAYPPPFVSFIGRHSERNHACWLLGETAGDPAVLGEGGSTTLRHCRRMDPGSHCVDYDHWLLPPAWRPGRGVEDGTVVDTAHPMLQRASDG